MNRLEKRVEALEATAGPELVEVLGLTLSSADLKRAIEQAQGTRFPVVPCAELDAAAMEMEQ